MVQQEKATLVSVIVPIYNIPSEFIRKCLDSVRKQTFTNLEILMVDDGSKAYVAEVCCAYQKADERFRYIRQENRGLAGARNTGVRSARGEYLCFVDPDDWVDAACFETLYELISHTAADIAVVDAVVHYRSHTVDNHFLRGPERVLTGPDKNELLYQLLSKKLCSYYPPEIAAGVTWAKLYRRNFLEKNEIWSVEGLKRMQDNVLNMYAFEHAGSIAYRPVCLYHYRKAQGSASHRYNPHIVNDFEQYYEEAGKYLYTFQKEQELWAALYMKELTSFHSYLRYYYFHRESGLSRIEADRKVRELLEKEPYRTALRHVNARYLTRQEYAFVFALSRHLFSALRIMIKVRDWGKEHPGMRLLIPSLKKTLLWRAARVPYRALINYRYLHAPIPRFTTEKQTVFVLSQSLYGGGAERVACILASALAERYHVVLLYNGEKNKRYLIDEKVEIIRMPSFKGDRNVRLKLLVDYVRRFKKVRNVAASFSFMFIMNYINVFSKGAEKVICSERNSPLKREPEHMPIIREMYAQADHVVFQSALVRDLFDEKVRVHSTILPNPVSVSCRRSALVRHRIVNIGRLNPQKNQSMLIRAFARFSEVHDVYTLSFYGDGELQPDLEKLARNLGLQDKILFHGNVETVHEAIADAEMFVLSSDFEGLSNALLECMMMGMPCISTACEGSVDVIRDGGNGLLTEVGNEEQLLQAMLRLAEDEGFRERLGRAAAETAEHFRKEVVVQQWMDLVEELINGNKLPSNEELFVKKASGSKSKKYGFADLQWETGFLSPHRFGEDTKEMGSVPPADRFINCRDGILHIRIPEGKGKTTDCGYDQMACFYTRIPAKYNVIFRADVRVYEFMKSGFPTFQEGFGLFLRDVMENDSETGYPYSNMAAAGVGLGGYNFWGRAGCTAESLEDIQNFSAFGKRVDMEPLRAVKDRPIVLRLMIGKTETGLCASVLDKEGRNLLQPGKGSGARTVHGGISVGADGVCQIAAPDTMFFQRDPEYLYLGFMAAGGCEMRVNLASVSVELRECREEQNVRQTAGQEAAGVLYASPEGNSIGDGTENFPYDLQTAVRRCKAGQMICVLLGRYELHDDLLLGSKPGVSAEKKCRIFCEQKHGAVLDFGGCSGSLIVSGDYWEIDGLAVTGGMGIQIWGSHNHVVNCKAYENLETGILIRHPDNDSDREWWPSYNMIEDCVSFCNRDVSGHNADGFACKVAAGEGNRFLRCFAWLNSDDGFDLFAKNRKIGAVFLQSCRSWMNGYSLTEEGALCETEGNGNGFKLGGSGLGIAHIAESCEAVGNKGNGFTSNSNPLMDLRQCSAGYNRKGNMQYYYTGFPGRKEFVDCQELTEEVSSEELLERLKQNTEITD